MKARWRSILQYTNLTIIVGLLAWFLIQPVLENNTGFENKTLWDRLELLVIPLVLALGVFYLERSERRTESAIATDRQQEMALQNYIDRMADLLLKEGLRTTENEEVCNVARIRTLTVVRGLDAARKGFVLRFLYESGLIRREKPIVDLIGADLRGADLLHDDWRRAYQLRIELCRVNLRGAVLSGANLANADLSGATLEGADLRGANLRGANLSGTDLLAADLRDADLSHIITGKYQLDPSGAELYTDFLGADTTGTNFAFADLTHAIFNETQLPRAKSLKGVTVSGGAKHK